jgi:hypothetical protein
MTANGNGCGNDQCGDQMKRSGWGRERMWEGRIGRQEWELQVAEAMQIWWLAAQPSFSPSHCVRERLRGSFVTKLLSPSPLGILFESPSRFILVLVMIVR